MSFKAIGKEQYEVILNHATEINNSIEDYTLLESTIASLNSDCVMCYHILQKLSQTNLACAKRLEQWKLYNNNKILVQQNDNLQTEIRRARTDIWLTSSSKTSDVAWFIVIIKWILIIFLAPLFMLPWALKDPYKYEFCINHWENRPIKKERIRRLAIYAIVTLIWFLTIGSFWFK